MKIAVIEPCQDAFHVYSGMPKWPMLAPVIIGTILERAGHEVDVICENLTGKVTEKQLRKCDAVGISIISPNAPRGYEIGKQFRRINPNGRIVFGGYHASFFPEEAFEHGEANCVVVGEGEARAIEAFESDLEKILGRDEFGEGKKMDLNDVPIPNLSLIAGYEKLKSVPIQTARGCPNRCSFCGVWMIDGIGYRFRDADLVVEEFRMRQREMNLRGRRLSTFIYDDNLFANPRRARELLEKLKRAGIDMRFIAQVRAMDVVNHPELVALEAQAGCYANCNGLETENQKKMHEFGKREDVACHGECIRIQHEQCIRSHGMNMYNDEVIEIHPDIDSLQLMVLTPAPGGKPFEETLARGEEGFLPGLNPRENVEAWKFFNGMYVVTWPKGISPRRLQTLGIKAYQEFYSWKNVGNELLHRDFYGGVIRLIGHRIVKQWEKQNRAFIESLPDTVLA